LKETKNHATTKRMKNPTSLINVLIDIGTHSNKPAAHRLSQEIVTVKLAKILGSNQTTAACQLLKHGPFLKAAVEAGDEAAVNRICGLGVME